MKSPPVLIFLILLKEGFAVWLVNLLSEYHTEQFDGFVELHISNEIDVVDLFGHVAWNAALLPHLRESFLKQLFIRFDVVSNNLFYFVVENPVLF